MGTLLRTHGITISEVEGRILQEFRKPEIAELRGTDLCQIADVSRGSIYVFLKRMEQKKLLKSRQGTHPPGVVGPLPRFWSITTFGREIATKIEIFL